MSPALLLIHVIYIAHLFYVHQRHSASLKIRRCSLYICCQFGRFTSVGSFSMLEDDSGPRFLGKATELPFSKFTFPRIIHC